MKSLELQQIVNETSYDRNKVEFVKNLYWELRRRDIDVTILNDRYLIIDNVEYQFIHRPSKGTYEVKLMCE